MNLADMLDEAASRFGDKTAIMSGSESISYRELRDASNRVANSLDKLGIEKGERAVILLANSPEFIITYFGIVKTGAIAVLLDPKYKLYELKALFRDCQPRFLITESPNLEALEEALPTFNSVKKIIDLGAKPTSRHTTFRDLLASPEYRPGPSPDPDSIAHIAYTAGPSLKAHGVAMSHECLVLESIASARGFEQTAEDILPLFALPLHHAAGMVILLTTSLVSGSKVIMIPGVSIPALTGAIEKHRITMLLGMPFIFAMMNRAAQDDGIKHDLTSLRLCASGGQPLTPEIGADFKRLYGRDLIQFWGLTEAAAHVTCQTVDGSGKPGAVGKALPGWLMKVTDAHGAELPPGSDGEVFVKGPFMKGYYNNPRATAEIIKGGWLDTGDIGRLDASGELTITGRTKDMIIVKGQNIWPGDIEEVLRLHPKVLEAVALGIPDAMRGEVVGAAVRLKPGESATEWELKQLCLENLANYKVPKQVIFRESFPRATDGKIDKAQLRQQLEIPGVYFSPVNW